MADAISAATIAAVDRHLAHLGLYPRSDSAGLAPVPPPPPRRTGVVDPTTHSPAPVRYSVATPSHLQYTFASLAPAAQSPPRRTGVVDPTTHSSAPVQYSAVAPAPLQYTSAGLAFVAQPPPTDGCCGPHHTLLRSLTVLCCTAAPGSGHFGGFHRPHCVAAVANASPCHGQSRDLCRPCCTAAPGSGHLAFSRPPPSPLWPLVPETAILLRVLTPS